MRQERGGCKEATRGHCAVRTLRADPGSVSRSRRKVSNAAPPVRCFGPSPRHLQGAQCGSQSQSQSRHLLHQSQRKQERPAALEKKYFFRTGGKAQRPRPRCQTCDPWEAPRSAPRALGPLPRRPRSASSHPADGLEGVQTAQGSLKRRSRQRQRAPGDSPECLR